MTVPGVRPPTYEDIVRAGQQFNDYAPASSEADTAIPQLESHTLTPATEVLYRGLGHLAQTPLVDGVVDEILEYHVELSRWSRHNHTFEANGQFAVLYRDIRDIDDPDILPEITADEGRRRIHKDGSSFLVAMRQITAEDVRDILDMERKVERVGVNEIHQGPTIAVLRNRFKQHWVHWNGRNRGQKEQPEDTFSIVEAAALGMLTHFNNYDDISKLLGVGDTVLSRLLHPVAARYGVRGGGSSVDFMLVAIAEGVASIDHIPEGLTSELKGTPAGIVQDYYSHDDVVRKTTRSLNINTVAANFKRASDSINVKGSKELVKHLLRDGRIGMPVIDHNTEGKPFLSITQAPNPILPIDR